MELLRLIAEDASLWASLLALVIAFYATVHARRSAKAAEKSARSAEEALALEREEVRETWIRRLEAALPHPQRVTGLLSDLPSYLRPHWLQLLTSAARRNDRTPDRHFKELLAEHSEAWEEAALDPQPPGKGKRE